MRLCASLSRGVAAPLSCVICLQLGDVAVFSLCAQYFLNVRGGGGITTLGAFRTFTNIPGPGIRTAYFAALGSWPGVLPKNTESLRDSDALMRVAVPKAFCVLLEHTGPRPKSGKACRSDTRAGDVCERAERSEGSDTTLHPKHHLFRRVCPCVRSFFERRVCIPAFGCESKRGAFVREVEKVRYETVLDRVCDGNSAGFSPSADSGGSQRTGKCMYIKAWQNQGLQM